MLKNISDPEMIEVWEVGVGGFINKLFEAQKDKSDLMRYVMSDKFAEEVSSAKRDLDYCTKMAKDFL